MLFPHTLTCENFCATAGNEQINTDGEPERRTIYDWIYCFFGMRERDLDELLERAVIAICDACRIECSEKLLNDFDAEDLDDMTADMSPGELHQIWEAIISATSSPSRVAIVLQIGDRFYHGVSKSGRLTTAWCLAGAKLFNNCDTTEIVKVQKMFASKGKHIAPRKVLVP